MARQELVAAAFVEFADTLVSGFDIVEFLDRLVTRCVQVLGVSAAGLLVG